MRKIILITGKEESGKTRLSKQLADVFAKENQVLLSGKDIGKGKFSFSSINENTKSLIIDDLPKQKLEDAIFITFEKIVINKIGSEPFEKEIDQVIINMNSDDELISYIESQPSLFRRVAIINLDEYVH